MPDEPKPWMTIYDYIRESRSHHHRSAKAFWKSVRAPFSYEYYSNIERGSKFPNIETVLFLCDALKMERKKACFLWAMECMPNKETRAFFQWDDLLLRKDLPVGSQVTLEETFLINEAHKQLLESSPYYWEVLSFFAMHEDLFFTLQELFEKIAMPKQQLMKILGDLVQHGLLKYQRRRYAHPRTYMHIPNDRHFFKLRNQNFLHATKQLIHGITPEAIIDERAYRTTINKKLTANQVDQLYKTSRSLVSEIVNMQSPLTKHEGLPYSFCILLSPRNFAKRAQR